MQYIMIWYNAVGLLFLTDRRSHRSTPLKKYFMASMARPNTLLSSISANFISLIQFRLFPLHSTTIRYSSNFCLSFLQFFVNPGIESKVQYNQELANQFCWCLPLKSAVLQQSWSIAQIDLCTILVLTQLCKDFQLDKLPPNFGEMIERMEMLKQPQPFAIFLAP